MTITYFGHSCVHLKTQNGTTILIDPFISGNSSAKHVNIDEIDVDFMLITHGHQDHILDVDQITKRTNCTIVSNFEIANHFANKGFETIGMNHGGTVQLDDFSAKYVNAIHTSSFPDGSYAGQPGGFVISADNQSIYHAGDTALTYDMKLIADEFDLNLAILPIGGHFTMGVSDARIAANFVGCDTVMGIHFNTFPPIEIDIEQAKSTFESNNKKLMILEIGESKAI